jgi:hypothetical protein
MMIMLNRVRVSAGVAAFLGCWLNQPALAFHNGGVGDCNGCHIMHGASEGGTSPSGGNGVTATVYLLRGGDPSSTCLSCHEQPDENGPSAYLVSTPVDELNGVAPKQMTPGGDFGWIRRGRSFSRSGIRVTIDGERFGHNIVAKDYGYGPDSRVTMAPGGTFPSDRLGCTSCHDPHGRYRRTGSGVYATEGTPIVDSGSYADSRDPDQVNSVGSYRLLAGKDYLPRSASGATAFINDPPAAVSPRQYNRSEAFTETRVAYGRGMSEWCANCHLAVHTGTANADGARHPAGERARLGTVTAATYNAYVKTGDLGGRENTSYTSLVPFEEGTADYGQLKAHAVADGSRGSGPDQHSTVGCLTCHRAHASGFTGMTRSNLASEIITVADAAGLAAYDGSTTDGRINMGMGVVEQTTAYYGRPATRFAPMQRSLCNKCHRMD